MTNSTTDVLRRLHRAYNVRTDTELAHALGVSRQAVNQARAVGRVPLEWLHRTCLERSVCYRWLVEGGNTPSHCGRDGCEWKAHREQD